MRAQDEGDASLAEETAAALAFFNKESLRAVGRGFYVGDPSRDRVAAFAPVAMRSKALRELAYAGADRLAALACAAVQRGFAPEIALAGGVFDDAGFRERVRAAFLERDAERARRCGAILAGRRRAAACLSRAWPRHRRAAGVSTLDALRGGLIVSVQAWRGSAIDDPAFIAAMAQAAQEGGAVGVRVEGVADLRAVRARVRLPIVGLIKREYSGFEPYITPGLAESREVLETGAEIVAFDATGRPRPDGSSIADAIALIHAAGCLALADCATAGDAASRRGCGSRRRGDDAMRLHARHPGPRPPGASTWSPKLRTLAAFCICEGGIRLPAQVRAALEAGADAVVVGTAITNVDWLVREFAGYADGCS